MTSCAVAKGNPDRDVTLSYSSVLTATRVVFFLINTGLSPISQQRMDYVIIFLSAKS